MPFDRSFVFEIVVRIIRTISLWTLPPLPDRLFNSVAIQ